MADLGKEIKKQKAKNRMLQKKGEPQKVYNLIKDDSVYDEPPTGEQFTVCSKCGETFEQVYSSSRNCYTSYPQCPACRKMISKQKEEKLNKKEREISVATIPFEPFPAQKQIMDAFETHRFVVIDAGNRFGKDRCSMMIGIKYFIECLNENRAVDDPTMVPAVFWWIVAPTERLARQNWKELKQYFPKQWIISWSDSSYQMETIGGGVIEVRSGYDPDTSLVGSGVDLVLITEGARFQNLDAAWAHLEARLNSPGRGRKKDRKGLPTGQGKAIINSSPIGRNYFYTMWCWGQPNHEMYDSNWWSCQFPWTANPDNKVTASTPIKTKYGTLPYEETLRRRIGERLYRQNYLGDFLADDNTVFKRFEENCVINLFSQDVCKNKQEREVYKQNWQRVIPGHTYCGGYDPATGSSGDSPWFVIRDKDTNNVVRNFNLYGKNYDRQIDFIVAVCKQYNYATLYWLRTGHTALEGKFAERGIEEVPLDEQAGHKAKYVQTLELAVDNGDLHVIADGSEENQTLIAQMNDYTEKRTSNNNPQYSNSQTPHDDAVSALYAAWNDYKVADIPITYCSMMAGCYRREDYE